MFFHGLSLAEGYPAPSGAIIIRNKSNIKWNISLNEIREKIKSVASALSVNLLSACGLSRRRRSTTMWYCLPDKQLNNQTTKQLFSQATRVVWLILLMCSLAFGSLAMFKNLSRIKLMRRIFIFSRIFIVLQDFSAPVGRNDYHGLSLAGGNPAP